MAKYTSDTNLIRGAAAVGASMLPQDMSGLDPIIKQGMDMAKDALQQRKDILNKLDKTAENVILKSGALGQNLYDHTTGVVNGYKDMYLQGMRTRGPEGEKMKMDALMNMQNHSMEIQDLKQLNQDFAKLQSEGKLSDAMNDNSSLENKQLQKMMANDYKVSTNEQGQMQYDMDIDGKTYSLTKEQYRDLPVLKNYKVGTNFGKQVAASYKLPQFNDFSFRSSVLSSLPDNVKELRAAMSDGIQGENFGEILAKYTSKDEVTAAFNTDGGGISDEEYNNFLDAVVNPDNPSFDIKLTKEIMADKLTMHGKSLWQEGQASRQRSRQTQGGGGRGRDTLPVNYGVGYITTQSANLLLKDIKNKSSNIVSPDGSTYRWNSKANTYEEVTLNKNNNKIYTPRTNQFILTNAGAWQQGYRTEDFTIKDDPNRLLNLNLEEQQAATTESGKRTQELLAVTKRTDLNPEEKQKLIEEIKAKYKI